MFESLRPDLFWSINIGISEQEATAARLGDFLGAMPGLCAARFRLPTVRTPFASATRAGGADHGTAAADKPRVFVRRARGRVSQRG